MRSSGAALALLVSIATVLAMPAVGRSAPISRQLAGRHVDPRLIPSPDGSTVYDPILEVMWLANANLAGTAAGRLGVKGINPNGSMDYRTARAWIDALNGLNGGTPYLGHSNWMLPATPTTDPSCAATGPHGNSFGFGCRNSALGSLYARSLALRHPDTAVPIPSTATGPFHGFQPYLYWSGTSSGGNGYNTFSFNTGWEGSNVDGHYMYVLPVVHGRVPGDYHPAGVGTLEVSADGQTVYDPATDVTWLADADLARTQTFGVQCVNKDGTPCIDADGSMTRSTAQSWIDGMNAYAGGVGWLGQTDWALPPTDAADASCNPGLGCAGSPMGELFYDQLGLSPGTPAVPTPDNGIGSFHNLQPYLYWSCEAPDPATPCQAPPATGFEWTFSFGNGFQGTDVVGNSLYVMVYYPEAPADALAAAITAALGTDPERDPLLSLAAEIRAAANAEAKASDLRAFIDEVLGERGKTLTTAQASQLIALAQTI